MSKAEYSALLFDISKELDGVKKLKIKQLIFICRENIAEKKKGDIKNVLQLFEELERAEPKPALGIDKLEVIKTILENKNIPKKKRNNLLKMVEDFETKRKGMSVGLVSTLKQAAGKIVGALSMKCIFSTVAAGVVVVGCYKVLSSCITLEEFTNTFNKVVLVSAATLVKISEGCVCFTVQAQNLPALKALWGSYQDGKLKQRLQEFLVTEEIKRLGDGQEVIVDVKIDDKEYKQACLDLMILETEASGSDQEGRSSRRRRRNSDSTLYLKPMETEVMSMSLKQAENKLNFERQSRQNLEKENENLSAKLMEARSVVPAGPSVEQSKEIVSELQKVPLTLERRRSSDSSLFLQSKEAKLDNQQAAEEQNVQMMDVLEKMKVELDVRGEQNVTKVTEMFKHFEKVIIDVRNNMVTAGKELALDLKEHKAAMIFKLRQISEAQQMAVGKGKGPHQYRKMFTFGSPGQGQGQFEEPWDIAMSEKTGNIAVVDHGNNRIQIFSSEGGYLTAFGQTRKLGSYRSVAFTSWGDVICNHGYQPVKISLFAENGKFIKHITNRKLKCLWRLSVGSDDHLIVSDRGDNTIKVLSPDGMKLLQSFSAPDCHFAPDFAVDHRDKFFVSYQLAHCVKVFSKEGVFLYNIGSAGSGDGQLNGPTGLAVDKFNNLIVCDRDNNRLQVFTLEGTFVTKIEGQLSGLGRPGSVAVSYDGRVFVADRNKRCVTVFQ